MICGAWGGRPDKDGVEAVTNASQNLSNMPVEVMEAEHPVRIEDYSFVPDSCGAGQYRGGIGIRRSYRILAPRGAAAAAHRPRHVSALRPARRRARRRVAQLHRDRQRAHARCRARSRPRSAQRHADHSRAGRRRRLRRSAARDPEQVREDVLDGKITAAFAEQHYARAVRCARRAGRRGDRAATIRARQHAGAVGCAPWSLTWSHAPAQGRPQSGSQPRQDTGRGADRIRRPMA